MFSHVPEEGTASIFCVTYSGQCRRFGIHAVQIKSPWRWRLHSSGMLADFIHSMMIEYNEGL